MNSLTKLCGAAGRLAGKAARRMVPSRVPSVRQRATSLGSAAVVQHGRRRVRVRHDDGDIRHANRCGSPGSPRVIAAASNVPATGLIASLTNSSGIQGSPFTYCRVFNRAHDIFVPLELFGPADDDVLSSHPGVAQRPATGDSVPGPLAFGAFRQQHAGGSADDSRGIISRTKVWIKSR